jgi:hypothetical protein
VNVLEDAGLERNIPAFTEFMIASCELLTAHMPPVARDGIAVARQFWSGACTAEELERARVRCWQFLDDLGVASTSIDEPRVCATRAVICLLSPREVVSDAFEVAHWFLTLTSRVADIDEPQCELLRRLFDLEAASGEQQEIDE